MSSSQARVQLQCRPEGRYRFRKLARQREDDTVAVLRLYVSRIAAYCLLEVIARLSVSFAARYDIAEIVVGLRKVRLTANGRTEMFFCDTRVILLQGGQPHAVVRSWQVWVDRQRTSQRPLRVIDTVL